MRVTLYNGARTNTPAREDDLTWDELADALTDALTDDARDKRDLLAWAPCRLKPGATRAGESVEAVTALVIDVDACDLSALVSRLDALDVAALVYASPSDDATQHDTRRVRVVAPTTRELEPAECAPARVAFAEALGLEPGCGVEGALDPSRLFFVGRLEGTGPREVLRFTGRPVDVDALPPARLDWRASKRASPSPARAVELPEGAELTPRERRAAEALAQHWAPAGEAFDRHSKVRAVGGYLARHGWRDDAIARVVGALPSDRPRERARQAVLAARQARAGEATPGWEALLEWSGEAATALEGVVVTGWAARERAPRRPRITPAHLDTGRGDDYDWRTPDEPIDWYCRGLAIAPSERKITLIGGDPGSGKGPLAGYLAVCFAFGVPAFGVHECRRVNVGILDFEGARLSARRLRSHARGLGQDPADLAGRVFLRDVDPLAMADGEWIERWIAEREIGVLVVDSYMSAMSASDVDPNSQEYAALARALGSLGIVVLVVAHARKPSAARGRERPTLGEIAGSFALGGMAATGIAVWLPDEDDRTHARVGCMRAPEEGFTTFDVRWTRSGEDDAPAWTGEITGTATREDAVREARQETDARLTQALRRIIRHVNEHHTTPRAVNAVVTGTGEHSRDVGRVFAALERAGLAYSEPGREGKPRYAFLEPIDPASVAMRDGEIVFVNADDAPRVGGKFAR